MRHFQWQQQVSSPEKEQVVLIEIRAVPRTATHLQETNCRNQQTKVTQLELTVLKEENDLW